MAINRVRRRPLDVGFDRICVESLHGKILMATVTMNPYSTVRNERFAWHVHDVCNSLVNRGFASVD